MTLYLIDAYAQIFRAYYAIRGGMRSPVTGEPTHAVFGFAGMLFKLFQQCGPHYVAVAYDAPGKTFRDEMYANYKATRNATPDDLTSQIPRIWELIEAFGIPLIGQAGLEADDIIATITCRILQDPASSGVNVRLVSKDKDLEQLLCERVAMFDIHTDTTIDCAALLANKGIRPEQVVDYLALMGDSVDNVPGVEGIGPKTAAELIGRYSSIDGIYASIEEIKGKRRENLEKARAHLPLSRELVTLKVDNALPFTLDSAAVRPIDLPKLLHLFQQLGFNRYQEEARKLAGVGDSPQRPAAPGAKSLPHQGDPHRPSVEMPPPPPPDPRTLSPVQRGVGGQPAQPGIGGQPVTAAYRCITTRDELDNAVREARGAPLLSVDTETTGLGRGADLCGISLAWEEGRGIYIPTLSPDSGNHLAAEEVIQALKPLLEDESIPKCGHNLKFDAEALLRQGIQLRGVVFDSMLAGALLDPSTGLGKLDNAAESRLAYRMIPITDLIGEGRNQLSMAEVPLDRITPYAAEDADIALRLAHAMIPELQAAGMEPLMRDVEAPLSTVIARMEANGILCDPDELSRQGEALKSRVEELRREIHRLCGYEFKIESTQQLAEALFDRLGLKEGKRTKTGRSTDIEVLEKLAAQEDRNSPRTCVPRLVIEYRQLTKLISTYLGNLKASIDPADGRIHSTFHQLVTATGRLASHNPNLQNIPIRTDVGRQIRRAFHAAPGNCLICADYSQIELRFLAHFSEDPGLLEAFATDQDIHTAVAAQVFNAEPGQVTRDQRSQAKTINFGIIYGVTPFGLARRIEGLDTSSAARLIADYKARYPGIDAFLQRCVQQAMDQGYVTTILGRRRAIPEIYSTNVHQRALGERLAINSVIQGSAADLIKLAMVRVQRRIDAERLPMRLLLQIHDELVLETPESHAESHSRLVCDEMERSMQLRTPLRAECGAGPDWLSAK